MEQEKKIEITDSNNSVLAPITSSEGGEVNVDSKNITIYNVLSNIGMADKVKLGFAFAQKDYQSVGEILIKAGLLDLVPNGKEINSIYSSVVSANENIKLSSSSFSNEVPIIEKSFSKQSIEGLNVISFLWNTGIPAWKYEETFQP